MPYKLQGNKRENKVLLNPLIKNFGTFSKKNKFTNDYKNLA